MRESPDPPPPGQLGAMLREAPPPMPQPVNLSSATATNALRTGLFSATPFEPPGRSGLSW